MDEVPVVTCFLRHDGEVLLLRRSDDVGSYGGRWGAVSGHVAPDPDEEDATEAGATEEGVTDGDAGADRDPAADRDPETADRDPETAARAEIREETGLHGAVELVRAGEPLPVEDDDLETRWRVHPFLFDAGSRDVDANRETAEVAWAPPPEILRRETVPALWTSYDRVRPRVATVATDREHGSTHLSVCALEALRDEAALAVAGRRREEAGHDGGDGPGARREASTDDWSGLADLSRDLRSARPSMAVVANRVNQAMADAADEDRDPAAVERAATEGIERALAADRDAAALAAERLPDRVATLSRSGTVGAAVEDADPDALLVAESRPGREGVGVAESLAEGRDVTLTTDAAFPAKLAAWGADALLVGADRILPDGRVLNKVGTRPATLAAPADCPSYVVAASDKVTADGGAADDAVGGEERPPGEVYDGDADLAVANPTFDVTPAEAFDAVITERGVLDPDDVAAVADEHRALADWE